MFTTIYLKRTCGGFTMRLFLLLVVLSFPCQALAEESQMKQHVVTFDLKDHISIKAMNSAMSNEIVLAKKIHDVAADIYAGYVVLSENKLNNGLLLEDVEILRPVKTRLLSYELSGTEVTATVLVGDLSNEALVHYEATQAYLSELDRQNTIEEYKKCESIYKNKLETFKLSAQLNNESERAKFVGGVETYNYIKAGNWKVVMAQIGCLAAYRDDFVVPS